MLAFKDFKPARLLLEKLVTFPRGTREKYNNVVFIAGGTASGKGFNINNMLDLSGYRIFDVDELKYSVQELSKLGKYKMADYRDQVIAELPDAIAKEYDSLLAKGKFFADLDMGNSNHVYILHIIVKVLGLNSKLLKYMQNASKGSKTRLPNIAFDITGKSGAFDKFLPTIEKMGYDRKKIHLVWVLVDIKEAKTNNQGRERVVPEDILLKIHANVRENMQKIIKDNVIKLIKGEVYIVLNKRKLTKFWGDDFKHVKDFVYIHLKSKGKFVNNAVFEKFEEWMKFIKNQK